MTSAGSVCYDADFYPYGGERTLTDSCSQEFKFTGKERDSETGNDYFGARFYTSSFGRFMSPDWSAKVEPVPYAKLDNPQSLNLYAYAGNNPESVFDPDGHQQLSKAQGTETVRTSECGPWAPCIWKKVSTQSTEPNGDVQCTNINCTTATQTVVVHGDQDHSFWMRVKKGVKRFRSAVRYLTTRPWVASWILPVAPFPVVGGVGPAGNLEWNPVTDNVCLSAGLGVSGGHDFAIGPVTNAQTLHGKPATPSDVDSILSGMSASIGYNLPVFGAIGPGWQASANGSGVLSGPTAGVAGFSLSASYAACVKY